MNRLFLCLLLVSLVSLSYADEKRFDVPVGDSPNYGQQNAPVTMVEFVDYQ